MWLRVASTSNALALLGIVVAAVLLLAVGYSFVSVVGKDDLCHAFAHSGAWDVANEMFVTWSGRWAGMFILTLVAQSFDLLSWQYGALVALSFPLWLAGFYAVVRCWKCSRPL